MKNYKLKRTIAAAVSFVSALTAVSASAGVIADDNISIYEFEDGVLNTPDRIFDGKDKDGNSVTASNGKLIFLQNGGETATIKATVPETGVYALTVSAYAPYGNKTQNLIINGVSQAQIAFEENTDGFRDIPLGSFKLNKGENEITIESSWGWMYLDALKIESASLPEIVPVKTLSDAKATDETKRLMSYLADNYGSHILSGQQEIYMYGHDFEQEFEWLKNNTGDYPTIRGFDFLNCANILYGSDDGTTDRMIDWAKNKNGITTASWHVTVPKNFATYEQGVTNVSWDNATYDPKLTDFDTAKAVVDGTKENTYYMACLDALAAQLKKLQDAGVPFIFRPLHEAEGGGGETGSWFWWGKAGSSVYKELWKLTYKTLTEKYDLHNIIWEWNSYAYATSADWYPGDEYVDLIAYDKYNCTDWSTEQPVIKHNDSAIGGTFYNIVEKYNGKKMVAMAENDNVPTLENLLAEKAAWLYFCTWYDGGSDDINFLTNERFNVKSDLAELMQSDYCVTLSEVPADLYNTYSIEGTEKPTEQPSSENPSEDHSEQQPSSENPSEDPSEQQPSSETPSEDPSDIEIEIGEPSKYGDVNLDNDVTVTDSILLSKFIANQNKYPLKNSTAAANADVEKDKKINTSDLLKLIEFTLGKIDEF